MAITASPIRRLLGTRRPYALLALFALLCWLPGFFALPPTDRDESRFAEATKQMLQTGDFVRIRNGTEERNQKPIGIYWLQAPFAAAAHAAGLATENPIWPYRIASALGALAAVFATFHFGRALVGREAALLAGLMLASSLILKAESGIATTDAALLGATTVAMGLLARAWRGPRPGRAAAFGFWIAIGVGILLKGPITPLIAGLAALALGLTTRRFAWLAGLRPLGGIVVAALIVLPWLIAIQSATAGRFLAESAGGDLLDKLRHGVDAHFAPPGLHLMLLPVLIFPATLPALLALPAAWRERADPATRFLLAWIVPAWVAFELVPTKLPHYPLPLYPALFLLAAAWVLNPARPATPPWAMRIAEGALLLAAVGVAGLALALPIVASAGLGANVLVGLPAAVICVAAAGLMLAAARRSEWPRVALLGLAAAPLLWWSLLEIERPWMSAFFLAPRIAAALHEEAPGARLGAVTFDEPSVMFLTGSDTAMLPDGAAGAQFLAAPGPHAVIVGARDLPAFTAESARLGLAPRAEATLTGFNYSNGRRETLTLFDLRP